MLSQNDVQESLEYRDGDLYWKKPGTSRIMGVPAGTIASKGYRKISLKGRIYFTHRLIWLLFNGSMPEFVDHRNRDKTDNRITNLRAATKSENCQNTERLIASNSTGYRGVSYHKRDNGFQANIACKGVQKYLGIFKTPTEAARAYDKAARELHGEFAVLNFPGEAGSTT